jgi:hypothetical protein
MAYRRDGRIEPGQPLKTAISATAWNRAQDAADIVLGQRPGFFAGGVRGPDAPHTACPCVPNATVTRWAVLEITGLQVEPSGPTGPGNAQFVSLPVLTAVTPNANTQSICVALEPIDGGSVGRVAVAGVVPVKLEIVNTDHKFARCKASTSEMVTDWGGPALILWKENETGSDKWGLIRIGEAMPTSIDVVTDVTISTTGIAFEKQRLWAIGATGVTGSTIGVTGC